MNPETLLTGTGLAGLIVASGYAGRMLLDWWKAKREGDSTAAVTPVANAASANEILLKTLEGVDHAAEQVRSRLTQVEERLAKTEEQLRKERMIRERQSKRIDEHDTEIGHIKRQFALAVSYVRTLLGFISDHGLAESAPEPPAGLHID